MKVLIIGGGAIGCLLSARVAAAGHAVTLVARPVTVDAIRANGLRLVEADGHLVSPRVDVASTLADSLADSPPFDLVVISVKAYDTALLAADLHNALPAPPPVLSVQNGVGNEETLAAALDAPILAGTLTTPVEVLAPGHVRVARPSYKFAVAPGPGAVDAERVAGLFQDAGFATQVFEDYRSLKWCKLLMNILANAQSAILGYTPSQIFADKALGNLEVEAWREALAVMAAQGISAIPLAGYPLPQIAPLVRHLPMALVRPVLGRAIAGGRGSKMPSLTYDLHPKRRGRSEVSWLNGAVAAQARELGLHAPVNDTLTHVLLDLVEGRASIESWAGQPERLLAAVASRRSG